MLAIRLPDQLDQRLLNLAKQTHSSRSYYVKQALQEYLDDYEDHPIALTRLEKRTSE